MATYEYNAVRGQAEGEEIVEWGYVVAPNESDATQKLRAQGLEPVSLKVLTGFRGIIKRFAADIK